MREYEIRILHPDCRTDTVIEVMHLNDHAAIRAAKKLAEARPFDVWRELDCIYDGKAHQTSPIHRHSSRHLANNPSSS